MDTPKNKKSTPPPPNPKLEDLALSFAQKMGTDRDYGYSQLPYALTEYGGILDLKFKEIGLLTSYIQHLGSNKKDGLRTTRDVWVSDSTIAERKCADDRTTIGRIKRGLAKKGYIKLIQTKRRNDSISLINLFAALEVIVHIKKGLAGDGRLNDEQWVELKSLFDKWKQKTLQS